MCVNKRREPTTDARVTRKQDRKLNFRTPDQTYPVVLLLREITLSDRRAAGARAPAVVARLAGILFPAGNLVEASIVFLYGIRGRNRPQEPGAAPERRRTAQAGQPQGDPSGTGERSAGGGE
ncbi:hypothetical protein GCM10023220_18360 [Streptomyces ziwulingensis]|uniref:Uncharacterized protein n=1 Tax=Streptomyces ziwulingensis TaxID=1045501 RepID=A0ABP9BE45_9ACTN